MKTKKLLSVLLTVLMLLTVLPLATFTASAVFSGGSGTSSSPYLIANNADMSALAKAVNGGNAYEGKYFKVTASFTYTGDGTWDSETLGRAFEGSGDGNKPPLYFSGIFDGNGCTITINLTNTNKSGPYKGGGGIFAYLKNATVRNLTVAGNVRTHSWYGGAITARMIDSTIENCVNKATVNTTSDLRGRHVGGIVGTLLSGTVRNCVNTGSVNGNYPTGGIAGSMSSGSLLNCYNTGAIKGNDNVGGMIGRLEGGTVNNCYTSATVSVVTGSSVRPEIAYFGTAADMSLLTDIYYNATLTPGYADIGISTGYNNAAFTDGTVSALLNAVAVPRSDYRNWGAKTATTPSFTPYFSGGYGTAADPWRLSSDNDLSNLAYEVNNANTFAGKYFQVISDITFTGLGKGTQYETIGYVGTFNGNFDGNGHTVTLAYKTAFSGTDYAGGLFGAVKDAVIRNITVNGTASGKTYCGGVVGRADSSRIENCVNNASVSGSVAIAGIAGHANSASILVNCVNTGTITASSNYCGGVVGELRGASNLENSYNLGTIKGGTSAAGGIVARVTGSSTVKNCYSKGNVSLSSGTSSLNRDIGTVSESTVTAVYASSAATPATQRGDTVTPAEIADGTLADLLNDNVTAENGYRTWKASGSNTVFSATPMYPVTVSAEKETGTLTVAPRYYEAGDTVTLVPEAAENYHFDSYDAVGLLPEDITDDTFTMPANAVTVAALFAPDTYAVTLNTDGTCEPLTDYIYGVGATLPIPSKEKSHFLGWYDNAAFTGAPITAIGTEETGDKEFFAKWATVLYEYELTGAPTLGGDKDGTYSISTYYLDDAGEKVYIEKNRNTDVAISFESWYLRTMYQYRIVDGQLDIRFVSMLNDLIDDYAEAGFVFRIDELDWEETVTTNEVYTTFLANEIDQYIADYSRENDYFFLQNTLFSEDVVKEGYTVTVYAFVTTKDGTTYHGAPITIDLADLI